MSIPVDLAALGEALQRHHTAYLLTGGGDRPHVAELFPLPRLEDGILVVAQPGRTAQRVLSEHPGVTVIMPPTEEGGYTLVVDGDGRVTDGGELRVLPYHAVLHRASGRGTPADSDCGNDCKPLDG